MRVNVLLLLLAWLTLESAAQALSLWLILDVFSCLLGLASAFAMLVQPEHGRACLHSYSSSSTA